MKIPTEQINMRIPLGLRDRIKISAEKNRRTMTSEVVFILEQAFPASKAATGEEFGDHAPAAVGNNADVEASA